MNPERSQPALSAVSAIPSEKKETSETSAVAIHQSGDAAVTGTDETTVLTWDDISVLMEELKRMAHRLLAQEGNRRGVQITGLVLTALRRQKRKNQDWSEVTWESRRQFFGQVHRAMWQALKDYARAHARRREQNAGDLSSEYLGPLINAGILDLKDVAAMSASSPQLAERIESAIEDLRKSYPKQDLAEIVEHYSFGGLTQREIGQLLEIPEREVGRRLKLARAILKHELVSDFPQLKSVIGRDLPK